MKKQLFFTLALFWCSLVSFGQTFNYLGINYTVTTGSTIKVGNNASFIGGAADIPATVVYNSANYSVTSIDDYAFYNNSNLSSVTIPNSVTNIGQQAFIYCTDLTSVTIPNSVDNIGNFAFFACTGLNSVTVSRENPLSINSNIFGSVNLNNVTLNVPFGKAALYDATEVWTNFGTIIETVVAPTLGQTFTENGINYIVTKATLPYEVAVHTHTSFTGAANIPASVSNAGNAFSVTSIGQKAFYNCTSLTAVTIPDSVTSISNYAFESCTNLNSVTIPNSVTSIGTFAFYNCTRLTAVTIPDSVTIIRDYTFYNCTGLTTVTIPDSVTTIGENTFYGCTSLTAVTIPNSVTSIGDFAFVYCSSLNAVTISNLVSSISNYAFYGCTSLTSVTIPNSVNSIGVNAFNSCTSLTSVTIPNLVTSIGVSAFNSCTSLKSVTVSRETPLVIDSSVFGIVTLANVDLYVPATTLVAYEAALVWTDFNIIQQLTATQSQTNVSCNGLSDGSATVFPSGGTAPYTYSWSNGETGVILDGLTAGTYTCVITDDKMISVSQTYTITQPDAQPDNVTTISACDSYTWANDNQVYTQSGTYIGTTNNCVTEKLNLTINNSTTTSSTLTACDSYVWFGTTYTTSGTYTNTTTNASGCNNVETLTLTINNSTTTSSTVTACDSYVWFGTTYTASGTYTNTTTNCVTEKLNLTITPSSINTTSATAVGIYNWNVTGGDYIASGLYNGTIANCVRQKLDLTILPVTLAVTQNNSVLTANTNATNVTYEWFVCGDLENILIPNETNSTYTPTASANYACRIIIGGNSEAAFRRTSDCFNYNFLANNTFSGIAGIDLYPNPSNGIISLKLPTDLQIEIYNNLGQMLSSEKMLSGSNVINIYDKPTGVYFLKANDGHNVSTFKIMKN